jgi:hypothetical protein
MHHYIEAKAYMSNTGRNVSTEATTRHTKEEKNVNTDKIYISEENGYKGTGCHSNCKGIKYIHCNNVTTMNVHKPGQLLINRVNLH